jgi:putative transport protein
MIDLLAGNPLLLLFTVIGLGYLIGNINIFGFKLGVAAVLFVGIAMGAFDKRLGLPEYIYIIGLVLFVYAIGLQSGPGFFASFQKRGFRNSLAAVAILLGGAAVTIIIQKVLKLSAPSAAGLFCGALTNTPALAATVETAKNLSANLPADVRELYVSSPVVTYGLAYPFGVFGVILWLFLFGRKYKTAGAVTDVALGVSDTETILSRTYRITNPAVAGKSVEEVFKLIGDSGFVLSRISKDGQTSVVVPSTILETGNLIVAVGDTAAMERARLVFGEQTTEHIPEGIDGIGYRRVYVSNKAVAGKTIRELALHTKMQATITRLRRGDVEFVPHPNTVLEIGDQIGRAHV